LIYAANVASGGGHAIARTVVSITTLASYAPTAARWAMNVSTGTGTAFVITAYALCAPVPWERVRRQPRAGGRRRARPAACPAR
jgi:hypothetical protein